MSETPEPREPRGSFLVVATKLDHLAAQVAEIRHDLRGRLDALESRVRSLEDDRLRLRTITLPASIALGALVSAGVKLALDALSGGTP